MMGAGVANDLEAEMARILLKRAKRRKGATWEAVARKFGLKNRAHAYHMAQGGMKISDTMRGHARQALLKKRLSRRAMKQGAAFLAERQRSKSGCYTRGGRPVELNWK